MNAKQAEDLSGISRRNLRFYEQQGLIHPQRNPENDYRDYSQTDIETLKLIRALRMLDAPLEDIAACLHGQMTVAQLSAAQEQRLKQRQKAVAISIEFCKKLQGVPQVTPQYIDRLLRQMDQPQVQASLFSNWKQDYQRAAHGESLKAFSFAPEDAVTTPEEFTKALCRYGSENNLNLIITKEGLEPEFEIDGIAYSAQRIFRRMGLVPVTLVRCTALHPEELTAQVPGIKGKLLRFFHNWWLLLLFLIIWLPRVFSAEPGKQWEVLLVGGVLGICIASMYWVFRNFKS